MHTRFPTFFRLAATAFALQALLSDPAGAQRVGPYSRYPGPLVPQHALALPGGTLDLRVEPGVGPSPTASWTMTQAPVFVPIPRMSASFVAERDQTNLAITFSAEASTSAAGKRMFVRALIDGQVAAPADVVFTDGPFGGARSFIFCGAVDEGIHTVEMQWLVDPGASASLRATALMLRHGRADGGGGTVTTHTPPSGPDERTSDSFWKPIPATSVPFYLPDGAEPIVSFSAETFVSGVAKRMFVRALIDGVPLSPGDVVFAQRSSRQSHTMRFTGPALSAGWHTASIEWQVDPGGGAIVGDRTLLVTAFKESTRLRHDLVVAPSGPAISTDTGLWAQVPHLSALVPVPQNGEIAVSFSGEVNADPGAQLEMRLVADGVVLDQDKVVMAESGLPFEVQSFTFDHKHVQLPTSGLTGIWLEWRSVGGTVRMGDRAMELVIEKGLVPDLAEAPEIGLGSAAFPLGQPVEAAIGTRKLLTIIHRIPRAAPNHVIPTVAQVTDALFGARSVADYYQKMSGGRFTFENAGVLEYDALKDEAHYWNHGPFACGLPASDGYAGGHAERWAESILLAGADVDFSTYDTDQNGIVEPHELAILIIAPQQSSGGFVRDLQPYCSGAPFAIQGVVIPQISEWFTSLPSQNWDFAAHELAHLVLGLGDMYSDAIDFDTEAGRLSLMGDNNLTTTHFDAVHKLALGWVTPVYPTADDFYELRDVKLGGRVLVLPREADGDGKEFFALEVRRAVANDPLYDTGTGCNGIIVWHAVESPTQNAVPPACTPVATWNQVSSNLRRGVRALRPGITFAGGSLSSWDAGDYDLLDGGLNCPPANPLRNALLWADGSGSGWRVLDFSLPAEVMSFRVELP